MKKLIEGNLDGQILGLKQHVNKNEKELTVYMNNLKVQFIKF
jgi:hypothetical protein